ncbi:MAG: hypothetical protein QOE28_1691 [Solirubrobacteraceae bacterium]|nr:hypothetical protein [Solirubrobacteraceae bacterium]
MSSLASSAEPRLAPQRPHTRTVTVPWAGPGAWLSVSVAAAIVLATFVGRGGVRLGSTTGVEIATMLGGAALVAAACLRPRRGLPVHGGWATAAFALLAIFTALSIVWSLAPSDSWLEANRTFAYLAAFAGAVALVRLAPGRWTELLYGVIAGTAIVCCWSLLTKVFPGALAADEQLARLRAPFEYWNSVGLMSAMAVPPLLWLAARRSGSPVGNALAWPLLGLVLVCLMLSYSRGSLVALAIGLGIWMLAVPLRLRAVAALVFSVLGAAPLVVWSFAQDGLTVDRAPMVARSDAGHELGALLLLLAVVLLLAGLAVGFATAQRPPSERTRRIAGRGLLAGLALVPVAVLIALAAAPGGITGQTSGAWNKLVDPQARTPANTPDRLAATSSVRARYWDEALQIHANSTLLGTGAGSYATVRNRYRTNGDTIVRHAHGYVVQTLSDLGWAGLGISLLAALAWLLAAARAVGFRRRDRGLRFDAERVGMWTLAVVTVIFGLHSAIDWTWFVPGNVLPALICAGWVAGRGPLRARLLAEGEPVPPAPAPTRLQQRLPRWSPPPERLGAAALAIVVALVAAWAAFQPVRAVHDGDTALAQLDRGEFEPAVATAQSAVGTNPLSVDPLFDLAAIQQARGQLPEAQIALQQAVQVQPANAEAWRRLGRLRLNALSQPREALKDFQAAYYLDPQNHTSWADLIIATQAVRDDGG